MKPPARKAILLGAPIGAVFLALVIWLAIPSRTPGEGGLRLKCTRPDCGYEFVLERSDLRDYPRGEHGEGFRCRRCDQFAARIANRCPRCDRWFVQPTASDSASRCPHCYPPARPANAGK